MSKKAKDSKVDEPVELSGDNVVDTQTLEEPSDTAENKQSKASDDLQALLDKSKQEAKTNYEKYLRATADLENNRRRFEKEKTDLRQFGMESVFTDLLPVLDSFNRVVDQDSLQKQDLEVDKAFYDGILMVKKQLTETLSKYGLIEVEAKGSVFDPNLHQAIQKIESKEADKELVKDEFAKGYTLNGRLIRPTMVSVLVPCEA